MPRPRRSGPRQRRKRHLSEVDRRRLNYREIDFLRQFLNERGKIRPRTVTGLSRRDQARLANAVKVARELALLPYTSTAAVREPRR